MEIKGFGNVTQIDTSKTKYKCRKWRLRVNTSQGEKTRRFTGSYSAAKKALDKFIQELEDETCHPNTRFSEYSNYWVETREASKSFSPNTIHSNKCNVRALNRLFGKEKIADITAKQIREKIYSLKNQKTGEDVSNAHKAKLLTSLKQIFQLAVVDKMIKENPCKSVKSPSKRGNKQTALSKKEVDQTIQCVKSHNTDGRQVALLTIIYLGLRRSEACGLKWKDYDENNQTLKIQRAWKDGDCSVGETKSNAGKRTLPVPASLCDVLNEWKKTRLPSPSKEDFICINCAGNILRGYVLWKYWKQLASKNNLHYVNLHGLRHTNLTIAARHMSPFDLQHYAGWSNLAPARIYIHEDQDSMRRAMDNMGF